MSASAEIVRVVTFGAPNEYPVLMSLTVAAVAAVMETTPETSKTGALKLVMPCISMPFETEAKAAKLATTASASMCVAFAKAPT